jgi:hypothetical protein
MFLGLKLHWSPVDAVLAALIATAGVLLVHSVHPGLNPLAYAAGWLAVAAVLYQTGSELTHRARSRGQRR